jgi:hypothetical protein
MSPNKVEDSLSGGFVWRGQSYHGYIYGWSSTIAQFVDPRKRALLLVTGAAMGLGEGIAMVYAKYGVKLCLVDMSKDVEKTADKLRKQYNAHMTQTPVKWQCGRGTGAHKAS